MWRFRDELDHADQPAPTATGTAPGKRTLTMAFPPRAVQRKVIGADDRAPRDHEVPGLVDAAIGDRGGPLPYLSELQRAFGHHDLGGVEAHLGPATTAASDAMGAAAFATGRHVGFAGLPTLHTVAHEAAHVIQQRAGRVELQGLGRADDDHERHADEVADRVMRGESVVELLDRYGGPAVTGAAPAVQLMTVDPGARSSSSSSDPAWLTELDSDGYDTDTLPLATVRKLLERIDAGTYKLKSAKGTSELRADLASRIESKERDDGDGDGEKLNKKKRHNKHLASAPKKKAAAHDEDADDESDATPKPKAGPKKKPKHAPKAAKAAAASEVDDDDGDEPERKVKAGDDDDGDDDIVDRFLDQVTAHFQAEQRASGGDKTAKYRAKLLKDSSQEQRDLDRLAWVLERLKASRVCVAVGVDDNDYYLFANEPDEQLAKHFKLVQAAALDAAGLAKLVAALVATPSGCRLKKIPENQGKRDEMESKHKELVTRRAHKAARGLRLASNAGKAPEPQMPGRPDDEPVHAEQQGTDYAKREGLSFVAMGISKLCCAKCWKALQAAQARGVHPNLATGTHWKTYASENGWPSPAHIADDDEALEFMIGKAAAKTLKECPKGCAAALKEQALPGLKGAGTTDIISSEDEWDDLEAREDEAKAKPGKKKKAKTAPAKKGSASAASGSGSAAGPTTPAKGKSKRKGKRKGKESDDDGDVDDDDE